MRHAGDVYEEAGWRWLAVPTMLAVLCTLGVIAAVHAHGIAISSAIAFGLLRGGFRRPTKRRLEIDDDGIRLGGKLTFPRGRLLDAQPGPEPEQLVLTKDDGSTWALRAKSERERDEILAAIPKLRVAVRGRVPTLGTTVPLAVTVAALSVSLMFVGAAMAWALAASIPAAVAAWLLGLEQIVAANDGLLVRSRRTRRFVPYGDIARVDGDRVFLRDGGSLSIALDPVSVACEPTLKEAQDRVVALLREGVERVSSPAGGPPALEGALAVHSSTGTYRDADVPDETLWQVIETPNVEPEVRARAAEVIRERAGTNDVRFRIADVAAGTAEPDTRARLLRVAEEPSGAEAEAVAETSAEGERMAQP